MAVNTSSISGILTSKVGGVPVALIGVVGVGVGVWYLKKNSSSTDTSSTNDNSGVTGMDYANNPLPTISTTIINVPSPTTPTGSTTPTQPAPTGGTLPPPPKQPPKQPPAPRPIIKAPTPVKKASRSYTVKKGDNLTKIAKALGVSLAALETANKATIVADAKAHGHTTGNLYNWIFPGEKLVVPA